MVKSNGRDIRLLRLRASLMIKKQEHEFQISRYFKLMILVVDNNLL